MTGYPFRDVVTSPDVLSELLGTPSELAQKKQRSTLDRHMRDFIGAAPFALVGTVSADGQCDVSPRGDAPGFVKVLTPSAIVIPERPGNKRFDTLRNVMQSGRIATIFLIPGRGETLRVNGRARVIRDGDLLAGMAVNGKAPSFGIGVDIEECFLHCAKAVMRSRLWERGDGAPQVACFAQMIHEQTELEGMTVEAMERRLEEAYKTLY